MNNSQISSHVSSLLDMPSGCALRVEELTGSPAVRAKLYAMGILPGTEVELCRQAYGTGSVCLRVRQTSLVLCETMAKCIFCKEANEIEDCRHHRRRHGGRFGWCKRVAALAGAGKKDNPVSSHVIRTDKKPI